MTKRQSLHPFAEYLLTMRRLAASSTGIFSLIFNGAALSLAWLLLPLENPGWRSIRLHAQYWFPQVNFSNLRLLDSLRMLVQCTFVLCTPMSAGLPPPPPPGRNNGRRIEGFAAA